MLNKKRGFTLAEIVICMAIIGIIMSIALTTVKPRQKAMKYLYMNAYQSVAKAYYNGFIQGFNPFLDKDGTTHSSTTDTGSEELCKALSSFINSTDTVVEAGKDYSNSCSPTKITSELGNSFEDKKIQFIAAGSGMRFYTSEMLEKDGPIPFYLVFVDLNGPKKPNRMDYAPTDKKKQHDPDIYAFAVLNNGTTVPLGVPEYDTRYMTARIVYFDKNGDEIYSKTPRAYYQAKGEAWGFYGDSTINPLEHYEDIEPHTMNDYIRSKINQNSLIVKDFPDLSKLTPYGLANVAPYYCSKEDFETCYVILDQYRY